MPHSSRRRHEPERDSQDFKHEIQKQPQIDTVKRVILHRRSGEYQEGRRTDDR